MRPPPKNEFDAEQTAESRMRIEDYLQRTGTTLWIEHDFPHNASLRKAPLFYD
jgi:hypothetical protein